MASLNNFSAIFNNIDILEGCVAICITKVSDRISLQHLKTKCIEGI